MHEVDQIPGVCAARLLQERRQGELQAALCRRCPGTARQVRQRRGGLDKPERDRASQPEQPLRSRHERRHSHHVHFNEGEDGDVVGDQHHGTVAGDLRWRQLVWPERRGHREAHVVLVLVHSEERLQNVHKVLPRQPVPIARSQHQRLAPMSARLVSGPPAPGGQVERDARHDLQPYACLMETLFCCEVVAREQQPPWLRGHDPNMAQQHRRSGVATGRTP
mmetsp:Transcript_41746/g.134987  ORF Transcript_41746/g.134987 Transcript_41746/m.134987 type:complete len:221 (+) Transcript_41746:2105-2767(+)